MKSRRILINALTTIAQELGCAAVLFFLIRFLIRTIGIERLGIWSLVLATTSVITLANQGFSTSVVKFIARYAAREQAENISALLQTALIALGLALAVVSVGLYPAAKWILKLLLPQSNLAEAVAILPYALLSLWLNIVGSVLLAGLDGHELIARRNYIVLSGSISYLMFSYALVPRYGLLGLAYAQALQAAACLLVAWLVLRRQIPQLPLMPRQWNSALFHEMAAYGLNFQFITVSQAVREPVTKALIAKFGGLALTGFYDMASRWVVSFRELIVQANQVLVPTVSNLQERAPDSLPRVYRDSYRVIFFLAIPTFAFLVVVCPIVSQLWLGRYEPVFVRFVVLLAAGWLVNVLSNPAYVLDLGTGALRWVSIGCFLTAVLNLSLGLVAGKYLGGTAVVAASAFSLALGYVLVVVCYHRENRESFGVLLPKESAAIALSSLAGTIVILSLLCSATSPLLHARSLTSIMLISLVILIGIPMWMHPLRKRLFNWVAARLPA